MGFPKYDYLSSVLADKKCIVLHCSRCGRKAAIDIRATIQRYGNLWLVNLRRRARCSVCGERNSDLTVVHPTAVSVTSDH